MEIFNWLLFSLNIIPALFLEEYKCVPLITNYNN